LQVLRVHGASVTPLLRKRTVTHIIAENLCWSKTVRALTAVNGPLYVRPQWVLDSICAGKRLREADYLLGRGDRNVIGGVQKLK
jgi:hypothetical protein